MPLLLVAGMRAVRSPVAFVAAVFVPLPLVVRALLLGVSAVVSFVDVTAANAARPSPGAARRLARSRCWVRGLCEPGRDLVVG